MRVRHCRIPNYEVKEGRRFFTPGDERIRNIWLERIGRQDFYQQTEANLKKSYPVCEIHFDPVCRDDAGRLKKISLPTLHLPDAFSAVPSTPAYSPGNWPNSSTPKVYKPKSKREDSTRCEDSSTKKMCFLSDPNVIEAKVTTPKGIGGKHPRLYTPETQTLGAFVTALSAASIPSSSKPSELITSRLEDLEPVSSTSQAAHERKQYGNLGIVYKI